MPVVLIDTNLLLLLIVGAADRSYINKHKRLQDYQAADYDLIAEIVGSYDGLATTPHILAEVSNLARMIENPARDRIQRTLRDFVLSCDELLIESAEGCDHDQFLALGLTDAVILTACAASPDGDGRIELLTADGPVYNRALSLGLPAELYA